MPLRRIQPRCNYCTKCNIICVLPHLSIPRRSEFVQLIELGQCVWKESADFEHSSQPQEASSPVTLEVYHFTTHSGCIIIITTTTTTTTTTTIIIITITLIINKISAQMVIISYISVKISNSKLNKLIN